MCSYAVRRSAATPELAGLWDGPAWGKVEWVEVAHFHPRSTAHRPATRVKLLYDDEAVNLIFRVDDRYVRCTRTAPQSATCKDSCVEWFVQPHEDLGYFNFEFNCGGALLLHYNGLGAHAGRRGPVADDWLNRTAVHHSLPSVVEPEIAEPLTWVLECRVPFALFEVYTRPVRPVAGRAWRANFYKCGSETSHPHWASWSPIGEKLSFHQTARFGTLTFAP